MRKAGLIAFGALCLAAPAAAQQSSGTELRLGNDRLSVSAEEFRRLSDLGNALTATPAIQDRAIALARAAVNGPDARHVFGTYLLEIARRRRNDAWYAEALDILIASRLTRPERLASYSAARGDIAWRAGDLALASALWTRAAELQPDNPQALMNLAQVRQAQGNPNAAAELIRRAIALGRRGQAAAPETWYRQWLSIAYNGRQTEQTAAAGQALLTAYPSVGNWRFALVAYRQLLTQEAAGIDMLRLMRTARALTQPAEYQRLAQLLIRAGLPAEARETLDDGISRGIVDRSASPIPEIGREIERALARASPAPPAAAMTELTRGSALAVAGRHADAEAVLRSVVDGPLAQAWEKDLARFWLLWLGQST